MSVPTLALLMPSILLAIVFPVIEIVLPVAALAALVLWDRYQTRVQLEEEAAQREQAIQEMAKRIGAEVLPSGQLAVRVPTKDDSDAGPTVH